HLRHQFGVRRHPRADGICPGPRLAGDARRATAPRVAAARGRDRENLMRFFLLLLLALTVPAWGQTYPSKPVRVIVTFPPGSTPDIVGRALATRLQEAMGQPFVVENRAGAGGNIGADAVAKSAPDGYTLLVSTNGVFAINKALYKAMPFDPDRDLAPLS